MSGFKSEIVGAWKLVKYTTVVDKTQQIIYPFGENPIGYLVYTPEGLVSVHIMPANRKMSDSKIQEKLEAAENYGGYVGKYKILDNIVVHYPEVCNFLSYVQVAQQREFKIDKDELFLEYRHPLDEYTLLQGQELLAHSKVLWKRA